MISKLSLAILLAAAACAPDVGPTTDGRATYVDTNGDGVTDGVDTNGDGRRDFETPACPTCAPGTSPLCDDPLVDDDGDGLPDGLDLDCDGAIDIPFDLGDGTGSDVCISTVVSGTTKRSIECTDGSCECKENDQLVKTCTDATGASCSIGGGASNCCGF